MLLQGSEAAAILYHPHRLVLLRLHRLLHLLVREVLPPPLLEPAPLLGLVPLV
jgi:hypothetical protein